jgi:hypothetical protein
MNVIRRYEDIAHFRAPYKDSVLQGFGADMRSFTVEDGPDGTQRITRQKVAGNIDEALDALKGMFLPGDPPAPGQTINTLKNDVYTAKLIATADALAGKLPDGVVKVTPFFDFIDGVRKAGLAVLIPKNLDPTLTLEQAGAYPQMIQFVKPAMVPVIAAKGKDYAILFDAIPIPADEAPSKPSMAKIVGWSAVGVLALAAVVAFSKRKGPSRQFRSNPRRRRHR